MNPSIQAQAMPVHTPWSAAPDEDFAETARSPLEDVSPTLPAPLGPPDDDLDVLLDEDAEDTAAMPLQTQPRFGR